MPPVNRYNAVRNTNLITSLGGTVASTDSVFMNEGGDIYASGKDLSAYDLQRATVGPGRSRPVGTEGSPLILVVDQSSTGIFENLSGAPGGKEFVRSTSATGVIYRVVNNPAGNGSLNLQSCDTQILEQIAGSITVGDTCDLANAYHMGGTGMYDESSYGLTLLDVSGGSATVKRSAATMKVRAAVTAVIDRLAAAFGTLTEVAGTLRVKKCGTHAAVTLLPGAVLDLTQLEQPFTITALTSYAGSVIRKKRNHPVDVTISGHTAYGGGYEVKYV